ncbi:hypothetical protein [Pseudomonas sp. R37(2017)]|uniref:hypothetical protein n=1 Tax=Pseudomonas sp. R37(2017) TaxID=1981685 RepID=UPI00117BD9E4|nr:hypothetical protein [Pseudomonas sp. R37(2017)]
MRARYQRAAAFTLIESGRFSVSDLFLRFFAQAFKPIPLGRDSPATAIFSNKINDLKNTAKPLGFGLCGEKNH